MNDGGGNGARCGGIEVRTDTTKLSDMAVASLGVSGNQLRKILHKDDDDDDEVLVCRPNSISLYPVVLYSQDVMPYLSHGTRFRKSRTVARLPYLFNVGAIFIDCAINSQLSCPRERSSKPKPCLTARSHTQV